MVVVFRFVVRSVLLWNFDRRHPLRPFRCFHRSATRELRELLKFIFVCITLLRHLLTKSVTAFLFSAKSDSVSSLFATSFPFTCDQTKFTYKVFVVSRQCILLVVSDRLVAVGHPDLRRFVALCRVCTLQYKCPPLNRNYSKLLILNVHRCCIFAMSPPEISI